VDELRAGAKREVDAYLAGGDLSVLFGWVAANRAAVYAGRDPETQELVDNARKTIDALLKGQIGREDARAHLGRLVAPVWRPQTDNS
jgi:hypothetical protein